MNKGIEKKIIGVLLAGSSLALSGALYANVEPSTQTEPKTTVSEPVYNNNTINNNGVNTDNARVPDSQIKSKLEPQLTKYKSVQYVVTDGIVYLTGQVESDTDYENIVTASESIKGVQDVNVEKLTVKDSESPMADTYITAKVKGALIRTDLFDKDIPSWTIGIETKNGKVFLSGEVASQQEKQDVLKVVKSVKGVNEVDDQIKVTGEAGEDGENNLNNQTDENNQINNGNNLNNQTDETNQIDENN